MGHWHVATGLAGYGPDGSDGYGTAEDVTQLADILSDELERAAEAEYESANALADDAEREWQAYKADRPDAWVPADSFRDAWQTLKRSESLANLSHNYSPDRKNAPLYEGNTALWEEMILSCVSRDFPLDISHNSRLYAWKCQAEECEHLADSDD